MLSTAVKRTSILLSLILAGCQAAPGRVATCENPDTRTPRTVIGVRQIVGDTAAETARHPARSLFDSLVVEPALTVNSLLYSLVHKNPLHRLVPSPPCIQL